jgi:hypothetical protein
MWSTIEQSTVNQSNKRTKLLPPGEENVNPKAGQKKSVTSMLEQMIKEVSGRAPPGINLNSIPLLSENHLGSDLKRSIRKSMTPQSLMQVGNGHARETDDEGNAEQGGGDNSSGSNSNENSIDSLSHIIDVDPTMKDDNTLRLLRDQLAYEDQVSGKLHDMHSFLEVKARNQGEGSGGGSGVGTGVTDGQGSSGNSGNSDRQDSSKSSGNSGNSASGNSASGNGASAGSSTNNSEANLRRASAGATSFVELDLEAHHRQLRGKVNTDLLRKIEQQSEERVAEGDNDDSDAVDCPCFWYRLPYGQNFSCQCGSGTDDSDAEACQDTKYGKQYDNEEALKDMASCGRYVFTNAEDGGRRFFSYKPADKTSGTGAQCWGNCYYIY